jgi:hypothetical protein
MNRVRNVTLALATGLLAAVVSLAQQDETAEQPQVKSEDEASVKAKGDSARAPARKEKASDDDFVPSEEISEDLSVPFPADI